MPDSGLDVLVSFDTTGSMYPCLTSVRRKIKELVTTLFHDIDDMRIGIIAHGDYCDQFSSYVTKSLGFTDNLSIITDFITNVGRTDGGDSPECYELVLRLARTFSWRPGAKKVFLLIGDDIPHDANYKYNTDRIYWEVELQELLRASVLVYGVHAMPGTRQHSKRFYEKIATITGGSYLTLDQFEAMTDVIMAVCYQQSGEAALVAFEERLASANRMTRNMTYVMDTLYGRPSTLPVETTVTTTTTMVTRRPVRRDMAPVPTGLVPVPPGRFQVLSVDHDAPIERFVSDNGLRFKIGRGFYEFMKKEVVQENKEVVLVDRNSGDMFTGSDARELIGVPYGIRKKIDPVALPRYKIFIQSTSSNRKLIGGTSFLYEVEDWMR